MNVYWMAGKLFGLVAVLFGLGCSVTDPPPPFGTGVSVESVEFESETFEFEVFEGETKTLSIPLKSPNRGQITLSWEILGGFGRFQAASGFVVLPPGQKSLDLEVVSLVLPTVNGEQQLPLRISSIHLEEPQVFSLTVIDTKSPAQISFPEGSELPFVTAPLGEDSFAVLTLKNTGDVAASSFAVEGLAAPFTFKGGSFPGEGGSCGFQLKADHTCTVVFAFRSGDKGSFAQEVAFVFDNGLEKTQADLTLLGNSDAVVATFLNLPQSPSREESLKVQVGGAGISHYIFKVGPASDTDCADSTGYTPQSAVSQDIAADISGHPDGLMKLCARGYNGGDGNWQDAASFHLWVKDTLPPLNPSLSINASATHTNSTEADLYLSAEDAAQVYVTNVEGCISGGVWEPYNTLKRWTLPSENATNTVYARFRDVAGNTTSCLSAAILHDNQPPSVSIDRAEGQPSSTDLVPVAYRAVFSKEVRGDTFSALDLVQDGTAEGVQWKVTQVSSTEFDIEAVNVAEGGSILPRLPQGKVQDLAGNFNAESTSADSLVTFNVVEFYFSSLSVGGSHSCALSNEGKAYCWGEGDAGQLGAGALTTGATPQLVDTVPLETPPEVEEEGGGEEPEEEFVPFRAFRSLAAGKNHSCGLDLLGRAFCWGEGQEGQLGNSELLSKQEPVAVNVTDLKAAGFINFRSLAAGANHTCGVTAQGAAYCWGQAKKGQLGYSFGDFSDLEEFEPESAPVPVSTSSLTGTKRFLSLAAGADHTCGLTFERDIYCWGDPAHGRLGESYAEPQPLPVLVDTSGLTDHRSFMKLVTGDHHTCALSARGRIYCWGQGGQGQLGAGLEDAAQPQLVDTSHLQEVAVFKDVAAGGQHTCGLSGAGKVYCWGQGSSGQLGAGAVESSPLPLEVLSLDSIVEISAGGDHSCALRADGRGFCWGSGESGQLGSGALTSSSSALAVDLSALRSKGSLKQAALGASHSCAVSAGAKVYCWGDGAQGRLGNGGATSRLAPAEISLRAQDLGAQFVAVGAGTDHSCGLAASGEIFCWGRNNFGQLGVGGFVDSLTPQKISTSEIADFSGFKALSVGGFHACALDARGQVHCWGYGIYGQIGDGTNSNRTRPTLVNTEDLAQWSGFTDLGAGDLHSCAVSADGGAYCWGYGANGRMGHGNLADKTFPTAVSTDLLESFLGFQKIRPGKEHTCGTTLEGGAYCWGSAVQGQLGDGERSAKMLPVAVDTSFIEDFTEFLTLDAGREHNCAVTSQARAHCWGSGDHGKIGDGGLTLRVRPHQPNTSALAEYKGALTLASGGDHSCLLGVFGDSYCWGLGSQGQLGNNNTETRNLPVRVLFP